MSFLRRHLFSSLGLLALIACSGGGGGAGPAGGVGPVAGSGSTQPSFTGGAVGDSNSGVGGMGAGEGPQTAASNAAAPLAGGFVDPGGDPNFNTYHLQLEYPFPKAVCRDPSSDLRRYEFKGVVRGPFGKKDYDGQVLRVVMTGSGKFFDEVLTTQTLDANGFVRYFGGFEFSVFTKEPFQFQIFLLPQGTESMGVSPLDCSPELCEPAGAFLVFHSLAEIKPESTVLPECTIQFSIPVL